MRRISSIIASVAVVATGLFASSSAVSAAGGTLTKKTSANVAPASIPNASATRAVALASSNKLLVIGRDHTSSTASFHLWKVNTDLSFDTTFGAVDLGTNFAPPAASATTCVAGGVTTCWYLGNFVVNEPADRFIVSMTRRLKGAGSSSNYDRDVRTISVGKISTGQILHSMNVITDSTGSSNADWSQYNPVDPGAAACTAVTGSTVNSVPLSNAWLDTYQMTLRPDGGIIASISCFYSNYQGNLNPNVSEYETDSLIAFKPSGNTFVLDTEWGTNGYQPLQNDTSRCGYLMTNSSYNTAVTSMSSTALYVPLMVQTFPRVTTVPNWMNGVTSYSGCNTSSSSSQSSYQTKIVSLQANGKVKNSITLSSTEGLYVSRWIIDPQGRWNGLTQTMGPQAGPNSTPSYTFVRILPDGKPDTSLGADGTKKLTGLPSTVTVNGASVRMNYSLAGYATTNNGILFTGFASAQQSYTCANNQASNDFTTTVYPYYFTLEGGLVTTYGTGGLGEGLTYTNLRTDACNSQQGVARTQFINSKGQHSLFTQLRTVGSQTAGIVLGTWDAATGVTGGGEGSGASGSSAGRVDSKVYATRLPASVQTNSVLSVLSSSQAKTLSVRTNTPQVCVGASTSILMLDAGRCSVRIVNNSTNEVVRRLVTTVKKTDATVGSVVTTGTPIMFKQAKTGLSKTAQAQVAAIVSSASTAGRIVIVGHSAAIGDTSPYTYAISRNRANAVKAALVKAGVKTPIDVVAMGYSKPVKTSKTEKSQAQNRRVEVFIVPK